MILEGAEFKMHFNGLISFVYDGSLNQLVHDMLATCQYVRVIASSHSGPIGRRLFQGFCVLSTSQLILHFQRESSNVVTRQMEKIIHKPSTQPLIQRNNLHFRCRNTILNKVSVQGADSCFVASPLVRPCPLVIVSIGLTAKMKQPSPIK